MKTLGWLAIAAVMIVGGLVEYGGPVRSVAAVGRTSFSSDGAVCTPRSGGTLDFTRPGLVERFEGGRTGIELEGEALDRAQWPVIIGQFGDLPAGGH